MSNVFLTVDTELSAGGAFQDPRLRPVGPERRIFGRVGGQEYGIGRMMTVAERYGLRMVFFVDAFMVHALGMGVLEEVCAAILSRGHDVQLHLHPLYRNFLLPDPGSLQCNDSLGVHPLERQVEMLQEGMDLLQRAGAPRPVAFRAGSYAIGPQSFEAMARAGLRIDSSYNAVFQKHVGIMPDLGVNDAVVLPQGLVEFPVTVFRERSGLRAERLKPVDINAAGFAELRFALARGRELGLRNFTVMLHSFSFLKHYDEQYQRVRPRWGAIARFELLCRCLSTGPKAFKVRTFGELDEADLQAMVGGNVSAIPDVPGWSSAIRLALQAVDALL